MPQRIPEAKDETEASSVLEILKSEGIYAYMKDPGSGEYMRITQGYSVFGKNIYVDEKNREEAERLVLECRMLSESESVRKPLWEYCGVL